MSCLVDPLMRLCNKRDRVYLESRSRKEKAEMCFNHLDFNKDSYITFDEFMATEIELTEDNVHEVQAQFKKIDFDNNRRLTKDEYIEAFLDMTQMHSEDAFNLFVEKFNKGTVKSDYWKWILDDGIKLIGVLPSIAAGIYRMRTDKNNRISNDPDLDWAGNFAHTIIC